VLISFRIADLYAHSYERDARDQGGRPTGQKELAGHQGRLILVNSVKVDGQLVYQRAESNADAAQSGSQPHGDEAFTMNVLATLNRVAKMSKRMDLQRRNVHRLKLHVSNLSIVLLFRRAVHLRRCAPASSLRRVRHYAWPSKARRIC
jgi:hypothetical protein